MKRLSLIAIAVTLIGLCSASVWAAEDPLWVDVRSQQEWDSGHLQGAIHIPHEEIGRSIVEYAPNKDREILLYCRSGGRAGMAKKTLEEQGYTNVKNVGGLDDARRMADQ